MDTPPTITSLSPATWNAGTSYPGVIIAGTNFVSGIKMAVSVAQGNVIVTNLTYISPTEITADVFPAGTDPTEIGVVTVTNP